jgi:hypothetical protein
MSVLRKWMILAVAIVALPTCSFAQVQSRVDSRVESRVPNGFGHHQSTPEQQHLPRYAYGRCWRAIRMPNGVLVALNCQPYPPL